MKNKSEFGYNFFIGNSAIILLFVLIIVWIRFLKDSIGLELTVGLTILFILLFIAYIGFWFEFEVYDAIKTVKIDKQEKKFELVKKKYIKYSWNLTIEWESETEEIDEKRYNQLLQSEDLKAEKKRFWIIIREREVKK